jgi:hypothetical protein
MSEPATVATARGRSRRHSSPERYLTNKLSRSMAPPPRIYLRLLWNECFAKSVAQGFLPAAQMELISAYPLQLWMIATRSFQRSTSGCLKKLIG